MADDRLRKVQRSALESQGLHERARQLRERFRAGDLQEPRLRAAAHAGDLAARWVVDDCGEDPGPIEVQRWMATLLQIEPAALLVALVNLSELVLPTWESECPADPRVRSGVEAARALIVAPGSEEGLSRAAASLPELASAAYDAFGRHGEGERGARAANAALTVRAVLAAILAVEGTPFVPGGTAVDWSHAVVGGVESVCSDERDRTLLEVAARAVIRWALVDPA